MTDSIQPTTFWPPAITAPQTTTVGYAKIQQPATRSTPATEAVLPNVTVTMPNGAQLTLQRITTPDMPSKASEMKARTGNWAEYIDGQEQRWAYICQAITLTLDAHLLPENQPIVAAAS